MSILKRSIKHISMDDLQAFCGAYYAPDNIVVVAAGKELFQYWFGFSDTGLGGQIFRVEYTAPAGA
jgi:hypothetical protein